MILYIYIYIYEHNLLSNEFKFIKSLIEIENKTILRYIQIFLPLLMFTIDVIIIRSGLEYVVREHIISR